MSAKRAIDRSGLAFQRCATTSLNTCTHACISSTRHWTRAAQRAQFHCTPATRADFTHAVIGGGVVGLAIARQLSRRPSSSVILLERHPALGTETSSRSSEVIHAGLYYPASSLKTRLCVRGRDMLYDMCERYAIGHRRTGKWIVAQTDAQRESLERIFEKCGAEDGDVESRSRSRSRSSSSSVSYGGRGSGSGGGFGLRWVGEEEVRRDGEGVRAEKGALESPTTGIVDSHGVMACLAALFEEQGGLIALNAAVDGVARRGADWELEVRDPRRCRGPAGSIPMNNSSQYQPQHELLLSPPPSPPPPSPPPPPPPSSVVTAETIINAAGLGAVAIHNMIVPAPQRKQLFYAKGNYFSYSLPRPRITRLVYPATAPGAGGLGTHLTLDLGGRMRFGPDVDWVDSPDDLAVNAARLGEAVAEIKKYLPGLDEAGLMLDYAGIRPKLAMGGGVAAGKGFQDFVIRMEDGYDGWVNLLGIESPGLTSSLAIAEMVEEMLYGNVSR